ncbi:MAG: TolC family protein [Leptolyngbya sp. PLA1]|nr:TolC family protein [Leptolyngbya sp. PLA1]
MFRPNCGRICTWTVLRAMSAAASGLALLLVGGCQSYQRRPPDTAGHYAEFMRRSPESPEVKVFADALRTRATPAPGETESFDPSDGLTCAEAEVVALVFNAELRLARLRAGVTLATAETAGAWEDPTIGVDLSRIIQGTPEPWKVFSSVGLTLPISGRLEVEKQRAGAEHAAELARVAQQEWAVRMAVRRAWCEWSSVQAHLAVTREFLARVDQVLALVDRMEQAGELARTEARLFRIERATNNLELRTLESRARQAGLRLRQLMGLPPDAQTDLRAGALGPARASGTPGAGVGTDAETLARRSPAMLVAQADYEAAERTLELEIRGQYPDLQIGPGYGREDGQDQVLLGLSVPIPVLNANRRAIAEARAQRELASAAVQTSLEQVIAAVRAAEVNLDAAARQRQAWESEVVPLTDAQYDDATQVARLGEVNALVLLESLTRRQEAKVGLVQAARDEALAVIDLEELLGPELPAPPGPAGPTQAPPAPGATPSAR